MSISSYFKKRKVKNIVSNAKGRYALEIRFLHELSDDLESLLKSKNTNQDEVLNLASSISKKLSTTQRRAHQDESRTINNIHDFMKNVPPDSELGQKVKTHEERLEIADAKLTRALSRVDGNLKQELDHLKGLIKQGKFHPELILPIKKEINELIDFCHAAIIELNSLTSFDEERRLFLKKAAVGTAGAIGASIAAGGLSKFFKKELIKFESDPKDKHRSVFLVQSPEDRKQFLAIKLRAGFTFKIIAELYLIEQSAGVAALEKYNPGNYKIGDYVFVPAENANDLLLDYLKENHFVYMTLNDGNTIEQVLSIDLKISKANQNMMFHLLKLLSFDLTYQLTINEKLSSNNVICIPKSLFPPQLKLNGQFLLPSLLNYTKFQPPVRKSWEEIKATLEPRHLWMANRDRIGGIKIKNGHMGFDVPAPVGTKLYSLGVGVVTNVKSNWTKNEFYNRDKPGYEKWRNGNNITIRLFYKDIQVQYLHLEKVYVKVGDVVNFNTVVGLVGLTGNAFIFPDNPHVHISMYKNGVQTNPTPFVSGQMDDMFKKYFQESKDPKLYANLELVAENNGSFG